MNREEALPCSGGLAVRTRSANFKFDVSDGEPVFVLECFPQSVNVGAAELDYFLTRNADEVMMLLITGSLEVAVVLLKVCRLDQALLAQEIECAVHG